MKLIVRQNISGINSDEGLRAVDGIAELSAEVTTEEELLELFEKKYPDFNGDTFEFIND